MLWSLLVSVKSLISESVTDHCNKWSSFESEIITHSGLKYGWPRLGVSADGARRDGFAGVLKLLIPIYCEPSVCSCWLRLLVVVCLSVKSLIFVSEHWTLNSQTRMCRNKMATWRSDRWQGERIPNPEIINIRVRDKSLRILTTGRVRTDDLCQCSSLRGVYQ